MPLPPSSPRSCPQRARRAADPHRLVRGVRYAGTLTRPSGTLSHRMGEGRGEGKRVAHPGLRSMGEEIAGA